MKSAGKRPIRNMSIEEKLEAVRRVSRYSESKASVARDLGVPESTLRGWCKNELKLEEALEKQRNSPESTNNQPPPKKSRRTPPKNLAELVERSLYVNTNSTPSGSRGSSPPSVSPQHYYQSLLQNENIWAPQNRLFTSTEAQHAQSNLYQRLFYDNHTNCERHPPKPSPRPNLVFPFGLSPVNFPSLKPDLQDIFLRTYPSMAAMVRSMPPAALQNLVNTMVGNMSTIQQTPASSPPTHPQKPPVKEETVLNLSKINDRNHPSTPERRRPVKLEKQEDVSQETDVSVGYRLIINEEEVEPHDESNSSRPSSDDGNSLRVPGAPDGAEEASSTTDGNGDFLPYDLELKRDPDADDSAKDASSRAPVGFMGAAAPVPADSDLSSNASPPGGQTAPNASNWTNGHYYVNRQILFQKLSNMVNSQGETEGNNPIKIEENSQSPESLHSVPEEIATPEGETEGNNPIKIEENSQSSEFLHGVDEETLNYVRKLAVATALEKINREASEGQTIREVPEESDVGLAHGDLYMEWVENNSERLTAVQIMKLRSVHEAIKKIFQ